MMRAPTAMRSGMPRAPYGVLVASLAILVVI